MQYTMTIIFELLLWVQRYPHNFNTQNTRQEWALYILPVHTVMYIRRFFRKQKNTVISKTGFF